MGIVYEARDEKLDCLVAIKTLAEGLRATPEQLERLRSEARAVARLRHPNIVAIHAIGEHDGQPYLSLEFVNGGSLADKLAQGPMPTRQAGELVGTLARAVHAAHQAGIVHRDLKPSNVLLTADGVPKVSDFGLAKIIGAESGRTLTGQVMGSPSFMAPEQAEGKSKQAGPPADIYALGAILYQALTAKPPFVGESELETLRMVASTEVVPPRRLRPDVPRDLETICLKCLEKEPQKRYSTAADLADDLHRFFDDRPISARPVRVLGQSWRWCRRNPKLAAVSAALAATVLVAIATFVGMTYRHNVELRAEVRRTQAKAEEARQNYQEARSAIQAMLKRLDDSRVAGVPRLLELRRSLREDALAFYDQVLRKIDPNDPIVRAELRPCALRCSPTPERARPQRTSPGDCPPRAAIGRTPTVRTPR